MNGHKALWYRLANTAGVSAIVGARIYPDIIPAPAVFPALVYRATHSSVRKGSTTNPGLAMTLFQVSSFDKTRLGSRLLAVQVKAALDRMRATTVNGVVVDDCFFEGDLDLFDTVSETYFVAADFRLYWRE